MNSRKAWMYIRLGETTKNRLKNRIYNNFCTLCTLEYIKNWQEVHVAKLLGIGEMARNNIRECADNVLLIYSQQRVFKNILNKEAVEGHMNKKLTYFDAVY